MPSTTQKALKASTDSGTGTETTNKTPNPTYPVTGIFLQEGSLTSNIQITIPVDFNDSFLIRGAELSTYLKTIPNTTKFCLVARYQFTNKSLILSAKAKSFKDFSANTTEFYLQAEPAQLSSNQNDCLTPNLTTALTSQSPGLTISFDLATLCSNCSTSMTSEALKLYFVNGEQVPTLNLSHLKLGISGLTDTSQGNSCSTNSACTSRGFSCCLSNQCVTDKAVRAGVNLLDPSFLTAQEDVKNNPTRFSVYPQYYYVCPTTTPTDPTSGGSTSNPEYDAQIRLLEQTQIYQCLNAVEDEYSYCTVKYPSIKDQILAGYSFSVKNDDINFYSFMPSGFVNKNNITKIYYAGKTLYEEGASLVTPIDTSVIDSITAPNDLLTSAQSVKFKTSASVTGPDDNLYLTFRVDGTCESLSTTLARCKKTYVQGNSNTSSTYYHPGGRVFPIPKTANLTSYAVVVKLSEINVARDEVWTLDTAGKSITFNNDVYANQKVEITYYVSGTDAEALTGYRKQNQQSANSMCGCDVSSGKCNLAPKKDTTGATLLGYDCVYPSNSTEIPPANQTVYVSSKNMPFRYYDKAGINYDGDYSVGQTQEGNEFKYTNGDILRPTIVDTGSIPTAFNEIYGSATTGSTSAAKPAKMVRVRKDVTYDLYTNSGAFSSCATCGSDYYSALQKIFPQNFTSIGAGYTPDNYVSSRIHTNAYRSDDLLFGRACFVPATMIPGTHKAASDVPTQRRNRLEAQHFLFANGYQKDWFGFDYGSMIGSFDGVTWFSIGNQRRIKATSSRLYLAVNSYFGDLNTDNSFNVTVSESTTSAVNLITSDSLSDGAECQKAHFCATDNDCIKQVGYDYSCQNVTGIYTQWPIFDANAQETIGTAKKTLSTIIGGLNRQNRRCVYRGKGAQCHKTLTNLTSTFNDSSLPGLLSCGSNNYCENITTTGKFNTRIARYANTPFAQNLVNTTNKTDTFGLGARIIGRPHDFYGTGSTNTSVINQLRTPSLLAGAICIPGRETSASSTATTTFQLLSLRPMTQNNSADKNMGIGKVFDSNQSLKFYNSCPATDSTGTLLQWQNLPITDANLTAAAITQNLSTRHLSLQPLIDIGIYNSSVSNPLVTAQGYQENSCLRAPGASCFSDLECGSSDFIAGKFKNAAGLSSLLNSAEIAYWREELICGNPDYKYLNSSLAKNPNFDVKKNKCCRDIGKTLSVATQMVTRKSSGDLATTYRSVSNYNYCDPDLVGADKRFVAGYNKPISSPNRYSRVHTVYDQLSCSPADGRLLKAPLAQSDAANGLSIDITYILEQYKTLDKMNSNICCTTHWVRNFEGGGHAWARGKDQIVNKKIFKHLSWRPQDDSLGDLPFECGGDDPSAASCEVKNFTDAETKKYLEWFGAFELTGIPQVAIPNESQIFKLVNDNQLDISSSQQPVDETLDGINSLNHDYDESSTKFISAASSTKMKPQMKKVFSSDQFNCCVPTGSEVPSGTTAEQCCTGYMANVNGPQRCCLPDYTDVSVYLNRYVSSEGRGLSDSAYDPKTGYIKSEATVRIKATNVCCSGEAAYGVAISNLHVPMSGGKVLEIQGGKTKRFVYREDAVDNNTVTGSIGSLFDAGLKWNNHVYCVPKGFNGN